VTRFAPSGPLSGVVRPPPDKSISHRAALIAGMGEGEAAIEGYLDAADTRATLAALRALGVDVEPIGVPSESGGTDLLVRGIGLRGPGARFGGGAEPVPLRVENAGTLLRMLPGWLAGQGAGAWVLDGDESIRRRPMDRIAQPLSLMGARVSCRDGRLAPVRVEGASLRGVEYRLPMASAQVKSCLLLAGLLAEGDTRVIEPAPTRDHTERMLAEAGADVESVDPRTIPTAGGGAARRVTIRPAERLSPGRLSVPGDFSSAAFLAVAAAIIPGSAVRLEGVGLNPTRVGLLGILNRMGAAIEVEEDPTAGVEPRGAVVARHSALGGARVHPYEVPVAIDELPLVALLGCFAEGRTVVGGAEELRHKESDRIASVVEGLRSLGAEIEATNDGFAVAGTAGLRGGTLDSRGDHRLAMLGAVAGLASHEGVEVVGMDAVAVSYPRFARDLASLLNGG
jgi:3-phosphoshikimate 1-carboxyvinyltransferase